MNIEKKMQNFIDGKVNMNVHINYEKELDFFIKNSDIKNHYKTRSEWWIKYSTTTKSWYEISDSNDNPEGKEMLKFIRESNKCSKAKELQKEKEDLIKRLSEINTELNK